MKVLEFDLKKKRLIIEENHKKIKYQFDILDFDDNVKLAYCVKYFWNILPPNRENIERKLNCLLVASRYHFYIVEDKISYPFEKKDNRNYFVVFIENEKLVKMLDNEETKDYIESIKLQKKITGVI